MANWKRLTNFEGVPLDVNLDKAVYLEPHEDPARDTTRIVFAGSGSERLVVEIRESPDEIHQAPAISGVHFKWEQGRERE